MFKIGDRVKYIGPCDSNFREWLYKREGIVIKKSLAYSELKVQYKDKYIMYTGFWIYEYTLEKVIPEYIKKWKKRIKDV